MNQNIFRFLNKPNVFLPKGANLQFQNHLKMVRLVDICQHRSHPKMKGFDKILYLMLLYFSNCIYEQNYCTTSFTSSKSTLRLLVNKKSMKILSAV